MQQYDPKNAFLHGDLNEEIYTQIPPRYEKDGDSNKVCRLNKVF